MYKIMMIVDGETYYYGKDSDKDKAIRIALQVARERDVRTYIEKED